MGCVAGGERPERGGGQADEKRAGCEESEWQQQHERGEIGRGPVGVAHGQLWRRQGQQLEGEGWWW